MKNLKVYEEVKAEVEIEDDFNLLYDKLRTKH